jgi:chemosensory pili system protein ChpA (sensor histidine kinase/response regulator)
LALRKRLAVKRTRVLVVDDALSVRRSMEQLLQDAGYEVTSANDGYLALDSLRDNPPAIVLTDLEMPNLNGLDLTKRIRELPQFMGLPVIMITSRSGDKHRDLATEMGVDLYLTKPYLDAHLLEHVRRLTAQDAKLLMY